MLFAALSSGTSLPWATFTVYAIMTGSDMDMAFRLLTSTGGYKKHCSCWILRMNTSISCPITATENTCSVYWIQPQRMMQLNQLLLSDCFPQREDSAN